MLAQISAIALAIIVLAGAVSAFKSPNLAAQIKALTDGFTGALKAAKS